MANNVEGTWVAVPSPDEPGSGVVVEVSETTDLSGEFEVRVLHKPAWSEFKNLVHSQDAVNVKADSPEKLELKNASSFAKLPGLKSVDGDKKVVKRDQYHGESFPWKDWLQEVVDRRVVVRAGETGGISRRRREKFDWSKFKELFSDGDVQTKEDDESLYVRRDSKLAGHVEKFAKESPNPFKGVKDNPFRDVEDNQVQRRQKAR